MKDTPESAPKVPFLSSHPFVASGDVLVNYDVDCPDCKKRTRWSADVTGSWCHECCLFVSRDIITDAPIITSEDLVKTPQPLAVPEEVEECIVCGGDEPCSHDFDAMNAQEFSFPVASPPESAPEDRPKDDTEQPTEMDWSLPLPSCPACQIKTEWSYGGCVQCPACGWYTIHPYYASAAHRAGDAGSSQSEPVTGVTGSAPAETTPEDAIPASIRHALETAEEALQESRQQILETADIEQIIHAALCVRGHTEQELDALTDWVIETHLRSLMLGLVRKGLATMEWKGDEPMFRKKA